ncbi:hypothetical protein [Paracoccus marcusii]|uniref:hypothetical protein n=1 Tax=Paracoccus marcusii TaxID=59779 RepID=UPI00249124B1|nr:hypothetical protein [Paracoccus marcusii]
MTIQWTSEAALCATFIAALPGDWTAYAETAGYDIVLVGPGGVQIGVEAKLTLNTKVLVQVMSGRSYCGPGPDFRAVLVGRVVAETAELAKALGITVLTLRQPASSRQDRYKFGYPVQGPRRLRFDIHPKLPDCLDAERVLAADLAHVGYSWMKHEDWFDEAPANRVKLPDYVPDVEAGRPSPVILGDWKINAIRICIWVSRFGKISRADFKQIGISPTRWMDGKWLRQHSERGMWEAGPRFPGDQFKAQHPTIYAKIEADFDAWHANLVKVKAA